MKKIFTFLFLAIVLVLSGCVQTKSEVKESTTSGESKGGNTQTTEANEAVAIELLGYAGQEDDLNIVRDQLIKNGFDVKINLQPDYSAFKTLRDAGNYDIALASWTTVTGNPDYAVRGVFHTNGSSSFVKDENIDALIDEASTLIDDEAVAVYKNLEEELVFKNAYLAPLYTSNKAQGIYSAVINPDTVRLPKSRAQEWGIIEFNDPSKNATDTLYLEQTISTITSLDPIKVNDGSANTINTNMYVRLVNLTDDDQTTTENTLSYNFAIAEGNSEYYFILRDDINFAKIENGVAIDTGDLVSAEDVVFSINRAKDKDSVPDHRTYSLYDSVESVEIVTNLDELSGKKVAGESNTVLDALSKNLPSAIKTIVQNETDVDNAGGNYQVVKVTTKQPFPQVLNYLAHQSAGIVSEKQVSSINTYDVANYDPNKDLAYGDQSAITEGSSYNNHLYTSGPYIAVSKNDYEITFVKNPAFAPGSERAPKIANVTVKFISDTDSSLSSLRNGEIHILQTVPATKLEIVESDANLTLNKNTSNGVTYLRFNVLGNREVSKSTDLRLAILYSINQDEFIAFYQGDKEKAVSTVSPLVNTGLTLEADSNKVQEHLKAYLSSK
ncbi:Peptide/nickel transport system substrate-binding protein OS=Ureibacillus acetophenoni OX=614649 GN=SAMN05877842_112117 PE=3 SV=1 [Ureibacillus acetophenoni]